MEKRIISLILTVSFAISTITCTGAVYTVKFKDLVQNNKAHWAVGDIQKLADQKIISGYLDGTYKPDKAISRAEFVKLLVEALKLQKKDGNSFSDTQSSWARIYIETAVQNGMIVLSEVGEKFDPAAPITRLEAGKMLYRGLKLQSAAEASPFKDVSDPQITKLYSEYIIRGIVEDGARYYKPEKTMSRAETAVVISRVLDYGADRSTFIATEKWKEKYPGTTPIPELMKSDEEVFGSASIYYQTPYVNYTIKNGLLYWNDEKTGLRNYLLSEKVVPNLNKKVYELTKLLIDDKHYVSTAYANFDSPRVFVGLCNNWKQALLWDRYNFQYMFYEKGTYNAREDWRFNKFSSKVSIVLNVVVLRSDRPDVDSEPFYEDKLKKSLIVLFGEKDGNEIFKYVFDKYMLTIRDTEKKYKGLKDVQKVGNIQIDCVNDGVLSFYFTL